MSVPEFSKTLRGQSDLARITTGEFLLSSNMLYYKVKIVSKEEKK
jgi:hypothetical protein